MKRPRKRPKRARGAQRISERPAAPYAASGLLLDTHAWIWYKLSSRRLGPVARAAIASAPDVYLSAASAWEIAIKTSAGKLAPPYNGAIEAELAFDRFTGLPVMLVHTEALRTLPMVHRDPFDRMLVAQAKCEGLTIVTADPHIARYGVGVLNATE